MTARWIAGALLSILVWTGGVRAAAKTEPPNVLLIVVDTLRKDHLGCYGYSRDISPRIDGLAAKAVRYDRAVSQAPWTTPSIGSLLTSQYPTVLGIKGVASGLDDRWITLPEVLRDNGYVTGAAVSHIYLSKRREFDQGFDVFDETSIRGHNGKSSHRVTAIAKKFLDEHKKQRFFLFLHYFDPHDAYREHPGFVMPREGAYDGPVTGRLTYQLLSELSDDLQPEDVAEIVRHYDSEIAYTDHHIGLVLDHLEKLGLSDETLIVFTADHGEEFKEHGGLRHAHTLYGELIDAPLIIKYPGRPPGMVSEPVALLDVYPTVLEVAGIRVEHELEGVSLAGGRRDGSRVIFSETSQPGFKLLRAAVSKERKLILNLENGAAEHYDLVRDPGELRSLTRPEERKPFAALRDSLDSWMTAMTQRQVGDNEIELTPDEIERLKALGYIGN